MPTTLRRDGDELRLKLGGLSTEEFKDALAKARAISGKSFDHETKEWVYPSTPENAMRIVNTVRVEADEEVLDMIRDHNAKVAGELAARVPEDAQLTVPWNDRLFPYQRSGAVFMVENKHTFLADDMGTGKTVQGISAVLEPLFKITDGTFIRGPERRAIMPRALVITPNSVKRNWANTIELGPRVEGKPIFPEWEGPEATVIDAPTLPRRRKQLANAPGWVVVHWEALRTDLLGDLIELPMDAIIADEAHRAKNYKAKQTKGLHRLQAPVQIAMTGTPILNSPEEMWGPLHWLDPETYPDFWSFYFQYVNFFEGFYGKVVTGVRNPDDLRFALRRTMIRRTKTQVLKDLPRKLPPRTIELDLYPEQWKLYKEVENELWVEIEQAIEEGAVTPEQIENATPQSLTLMIPNAGAKITRLRQIVSTPALLGAPDKSVKLDAAMDLLFDNADKQFVVFTHFKDTARILAERIQKRAKSKRTEPLDHAAYLTGDTPDEMRDGLKERFQRGDTRVLVATIMTGGEGIDLYAADTAIFVEREWTPGYNTQAEDRLHRQGQKNEVTIIHLEATGTVDTDNIAPSNRIKELVVASVVGAPREEQA